MSIFNYLAGKNYSNQNTAQRSVYIPAENPTTNCSCNLGWLAGVQKNLNNYVHDPAVQFLQIYQRPNYLLYGSVPLFDKNKLQGAITYNG